VAFDLTAAHGHPASKAVGSSERADLFLSWRCAGNDCTRGQAGLAMKTGHARHYCMDLASDKRSGV
jgi:hypothetical protein